MDRLYNVKDTLKILNISKTNLYALMKQGKIMPVKLGKRTLFSEEELTRFIESLKNPPKA